MEAALFPKHAFVDLETTGLDPARDDVIEVGALFIEAGEPVRRISRLFRPKLPLPLAIRRITGLTDDALAQQPPFASFVPQLKDALAGWTVVAHNAAFEQSFLSGLLADIHAPVLDSCELLHYLYPELDSHSLERAVQWAQVSDRAAHRALKDCEDTFAVVRYALGRVVEEGRRDDVADLVGCLQAEGDALVALLQTLLALCDAHPVPLELTPAETFLPGRAGRHRAGARVAPQEGEPAPIEEAELEALLGPGGALEREVKGFGHRPEQLGYARAVGRTLSSGGVLAIEAGTGTGKSLAYLAPAATFAAKNGLRVAVAPHTRALQDQLVEKDLPKLHAATGGAFEYAVLKGQNNYLCRRRTLEATGPVPGLDHEGRAVRAYLRAFARRSAEGDLSKLSYWFREHYPSLTALAHRCRSEAATTLGEKCPHYRRCFFHSAVWQAKQADVVVANQALLAAWPSGYPALHGLILDEAHELEDVLTQAAGEEVNGTALMRLSARLASHEVATAVQRLGAAVRAFCAGTPADDLFAAPARHILEKRVTEGPDWQRVQEGLGLLEGALDAAVAGIGGAGASGSGGEAAGARAEAEETLAVVRRLSQGPPVDRFLFATARPEGGEWALCSQPLDVGGVFRRQFVAPARATILTSATLSTGAEPWILTRLGLSPAKVTFRRSPTPFDLPEQSLVLLVTDAPRTSSPEFLDWAASRISGLAEFMGGRLLGLFASTARLEEVGRRVREKLEPLGIEVLRQSYGNGRALAARQEQDLGSVLLGTKSFWQGMDIPGTGVACVFIDKLPLEPQSRPAVEAREALLGPGAQGFLRYRLPRALVLLRQGVGRLIRSFQDRGVVILADPGGASYRPQVVAALDGYRVESLPWGRARHRVHEALREMGLDAGSRALGQCQHVDPGPVLHAGDGAQMKLFQEPAGVRVGRRRADDLGPDAPPH